MYPSYNGNLFPEENSSNASSEIAIASAELESFRWEKTRGWISGSKRFRFKSIAETLIVDSHSFFTGNHWIVFLYPQWRAFLVIHHFIANTINTIIPNAFGTLKIENVNNLNYTPSLAMKTETQGITSFSRNKQQINQQTMYITLMRIITSTCSAAAVMKPNKMAFGICINVSWFMSNCGQVLNGK